jgi:hypothetical protein
MFVERKALPGGGAVPAQRLQILQWQVSSLPDVLTCPDSFRCLRKTSTLSELAGFLHLEKKMKGYFTNEAVVATESRTSSPFDSLRYTAGISAQKSHPCAEGAVCRWQSQCSNGWREVASQIASNLPAINTWACAVGILLKAVFRNITPCIL